MNRNRWPLWTGMGGCFHRNTHLQEAQIIGDDIDASSFDRMFPNQDRLTGKGLGSLIALPFWGGAVKNGHTLPLDPGNGFKDPYPNPRSALKAFNSQRISEKVLDRIIEEWNLGAQQAQSRGTNKPSDMFGNDNGQKIVPADVLNGVPEGKRNVSLFKYACGCRARGLKLEEVQALVRLAASNCNPPYPEDEALKAVSSAWRYPTGREDATPTRSLDELEELIESTDDIKEILGPIAKGVTESGLSHTEIHYLRKMITKKTGTTLKALEKDARNQDLNVDGSLPEISIARNVIAEYGSDNIITTPQFIFFWNDNGVWEKTDDRRIKQTIHEKASAADISKNYVNSVLDLFKTETFNPEIEFDREPTTINVKNGELQWTDGGWKLEPHCREHYHTTQLPVEYDPSAEAPRFIEFLYQIFEDDEDKNEKVVLVYELLGYSLIASSHFEKFVILIGPGANGKSVLMYVLASLVGRKNIAAVQPSHLDQRFQRAHLHGKLVNLITELPEGAVIADAPLKAITSGEPITAEHKFKSPFEFEPYCTCWFGTNHMPHSRDFSDALFRRALILTFNRVFKEDDQDKQLKSKLIQELPGILNLAL